MHAKLAAALVASVRRRIEQGDCPIEKAQSVEMLEHLVDDLASALEPFASYPIPEGRTGDNAVTMTVKASDISRARDLTDAGRAALEQGDA